VDLNNTIHDLCSELILAWSNERDYEGFTLDVIRRLSMEPEISKADYESGSVEQNTNKLFMSAISYYNRKQEAMVKKIFPLIVDLYKKRGETLQNVVIPYTDGRKGLNVSVNLEQAYQSEGREIIKAVERTISLMIIDDNWKEHLRNMDDLKQAVQGAVYEQKDPLLIYKFEAFEMFKKMLSEVNADITGFLFKGSIPIRSSDEVQQAQAQRRTDMSQMKESREDNSASPQGPGANRQSEKKPIEPIRVEKKVGRNEPCPCGSGKKYKNCHGSAE
jgi:preprotein translocase subunit SecA